MKKANKKNDAMRAEYDFSGGVRGKHYKLYRQGHTVTIHKSDDSIAVQKFERKDFIVKLEPDVREYFPDDEAVNMALRCLIPLLQTKRKVKARA